MLFLQAGFLFALTTFAAAAPHEKRWGNGGSNGRTWWTPSSTSSYLEFGKRFSNNNNAASICDLSQAVMPTAPTPLPAPDAGLTLSHVAVGRGTQNYTCDLSNTTATPVAVGALATLFNVSCVAAQSADLLEKLPSIALDLPVPSSNDDSSPTMQDMSGHHYFLDDTTPFFNMDTSLHQYGTGAFKKGSSSNAPSDASVGQFGKGDGAVAWLKLVAKNSEGQIFQEVYRTTTAGGMQPETCTGMPAAFEVQYSAVYWLYEA